MSALPPPTGLPVGAAPIPDSTTPGEILAQAEALRTQAARLLDLRKKTVDEAAGAYRAERDRVVEDQIDRMPLERLKEASEGRLRLGTVERAGYNTVGAARRAGLWRLQAIDGVGEKTATQILAAASHIESKLREVSRVRFDVDARPHTQTELLRTLRSFDNARRHVDPLEDRLTDLVKVIDANLPAARLETQRLRRMFSGRRKKEESAASLERLRVKLIAPEMAILRGEMQRALDAIQRAGDPDVWADYIARSVHYNGLLIEISGGGPDAEAAHGFLPEGIVERINAFHLDTGLLEASLRGYQAFGAKFALVQERTILGDEMGLGKTIEALAVMCHLRAHGATHFLVVCPASVLANWEHEVRRHTRLERTWRLHGNGRDQLLERWLTHGGVAITTFGTLGVLRPSTTPRIDAIVIDEAHYVKNPTAKRTTMVRQWITHSNATLLMSGTPMENRVGEFKTLVSHVQPQLARTIDDRSGLAGAEAFRRSVAPVYLRRNQTDVLEELPPKIETPEWLTLDGPSAAAYRQAVAEGNFMTMRRAAFMTPEPKDSPKLERLLEIVEEAADNDRKVVVFSYFRDVIDRVHRTLDGLALQPITGSVPAPERQRIVDEFSALDRPAVLVSQIEAGGVGLNIQAASVVILTEPQWKPTVEDQAVARCHRMGQVRPVEVHRLLTVDSVDERMVAVLAGKSALFAEYVRASALKDAAPEAIDVTDHVNVDEVASQAEQERRIIELERRRLGMVA
jgi:superfamily II DNA or RNA helicase